MYATMRDEPHVIAAREIAAARARIGTPTGLPLLEQQVCAEAGIWALDAARRALGQAEGDVPRAVALLKVWAATLPHLATEPVRPEDVTIVRRISSAYQDVPHGQWLGLAPDFAPRVLTWDDDPTTDSTDDAAGSPGPSPEATGGGTSGPATPRRSTTTRVRRLLEHLPLRVEDGGRDGADPAVTMPVPPYDRSTRAALLARGETASLVSLASLVLGRRREAVLAELTVNDVHLRVRHPRTGVAVAVAEVPVAEAEAVLDADVDGGPGFAIGWGASLGSAERRAIAIALVDGAMQADEGLDEVIALDDETVVTAVDGSANNGFVEHLRLPHHASFASYLDQVHSGRREDR
ncbi:MULTISPECIES: carbon-phosphorus lyase complex subunit PhnI [unclassified Modestobacter]